MLNLIASVVMTVISLVINTLVYIRTPIVVGAIVLAIVMAFPATSYAAVIQCNASDCSMLAQSFPEWWDLLVWHKKAAVILFFSGLIIGNILMWHDRKVTAAKIKKEQNEWLKKYHS